ncbi:(d)CMP kinase [soil metagenome]
MIIAIDGPAGSGKSSTARAVARELGFLHLDSGAFYRALTWAAMDRGIPVPEWSALDERQLDAFGVTAVPSGVAFRMHVDGVDVSDAIRSAEVTANVSAMARVPAVRSWLLETLRATARSGDLVADGRDIGTVVFPSARLKVFLVADRGERARRRLAQMDLPVDEDSLAAEVRRIEERDRADSTREVAPLRPADDAVLLDTTDLTFDEQVARITALARQRASNAGG